MTARPTEPPRGIEPFMVLCALLADPFADVDAVLRKHARTFDLAQPVPALAYRVERWP
jgi:hypothetical protein